MGRKGWSSVPIPDGWVQIIRGPRPKSEKWTSSKPASSTPPTVQGGPSRGRWRNSPRHESPQCPGSGALGAEETSGRAELQAALPSQASARFSRSPDITMAEARLKASKLEQALDALEGTDGAEVDAIKKALLKAKAAAHEKATHRVDCRLQGVHLSCRETNGEVRAERASEAALLEEGRARLAQLEAQAAVAVPVPPATALVSELEAEVSRLREELASVRGVSSTAGHQPPKKRLREDFVPNTVEGAALWMRCRQQEMEEAISMGREEDVSRLACVIAQGTVQLRQWTQPPSSVGNMVS